MRPADRARAVGGIQSLLPLLLVLSLLAGCGADEAVDAELTAQDGLFLALKRTFAPESYWREKVAEMEVRLQESQEAFKKSNGAYREKLQERRRAVLEAVNRAETSGGNARAARREAIEKYRLILDPLRFETREMGREMRQRMRYLDLARAALKREML